MTSKLHQWGPTELRGESVVTRNGKMKEEERKSRDVGWEAEKLGLPCPAFNRRSPTLGLLLSRKRKEKKRSSNVLKKGNYWFRGIVGISRHKSRGFKMKQI